MRHSVDDIMRRLQTGEDAYWEFKRIEFQGDRPSSPKRDDWAAEIAAFANSDGGAVICRVAADGTPRGMSREQTVALDSLLVELCTDSITPPVRIRTQHEMLPGGERILLLEIPKGDARHDSPKGSFMRAGGSIRRMTNDERLRLAQRRQACCNWFNRQIVPGTGFGSLNEALWKPLLSPQGARNPKSALEKLALLAPDEAGVTRATVAGLLFCTPDPRQWLPNASIMATRYRGRDRASGQVDAKEIAGPLNHQITEAVSFAVRNMQVAARKEPARVDMPQYSDKALFEALVNAVAHRDYSIRSSRIRLSMFEDRLEIQSPGALPNNLTVDSMEVRQATRNEVLASLLGWMSVGSIPGSEDRLYFMERRGDGVPIIQSETRALCGRLPEYRVVDGSEVLLVIPAAPLDPSPARAVAVVWSDGRPLPGADVLILYPNNSWKRSTTDENGEAAVDLHTTALPMTVFAAAPGHAGHVVRDWVPARSRLVIEMRELPGAGAKIILDEDDSLPGLKGRLHPIRDDLGRPNLYASKIAINQGQPQPVHFTFDEDMRLTDDDGNELWARIAAIEGRTALVEYHPCRDEM